MSAESEPATTLEATHAAVLSGDVGGFLATAALLSFEHDTPEIHAYIERATGYVMAQAQSEDHPSPFRAAVLTGHAALYADAHVAVTETNVKGQ